MSKQFLFKYDFVKSKRQYQPDRGDINSLCGDADSSGGAPSAPNCLFARAAIIWSILERGSSLGRPSITSCWPLNDTLNLAKENPNICTVF